jgi:hypothetical protein
LTKRNKKSDWFQGIIPVVETLGDSSQTQTQKYDIYLEKTKKIQKRKTGGNKGLVKCRFPAD